MSKKCNARVIIGQVQKKLAKHQEMLEFVDESKANALMVGLEERISNLAALTKVLLLKHIVVNETSRFIRTTNVKMQMRDKAIVFNNILKQLDNTDDWWKERADLTLGQWAEGFVSGAWPEIKKPDLVDSLSTQGDEAYDAN